MISQISTYASDNNIQFELFQYQGRTIIRLQTNVWPSIEVDGFIQCLEKYGEVDLLTVDPHILLSLKECTIDYLIEKRDTNDELRLQYPECDLFTIQYEKYKRLVNIHIPLNG
jgi:hypothetical protein